MAKYLGASVEQLVSNIDLASVIQNHTFFKDTCVLEQNGLWNFIEIASHNILKFEFSASAIF